MYQLMIKYPMPSGNPVHTTVDVFITLRSYWNLREYNHEGFADLFEDEGIAEQRLLNHFAWGQIPQQSVCSVVEVIIPN